jgi:hypothetical protein
MLCPHFLGQAAHDDEGKHDAAKSRELLPRHSVKNLTLGSPNSINLSKPTDYEIHHQFNIQQLYALPTLYLCVLYLSENKQRLVPLTA